MDISLWEVIKAAKTKPFGYMAFYPGPGLGGHCIPIDPFYLSWKAKQFDFRTEFIDLSGRINENMPYYVIDRLMDALNAQRKPLADSKVLVLGVAYKADVVYHDPFVPSFAVSGTEIPSVDLTAETVAAADVVLVITAHSDVDYALVAREASLVLDTRNALEQYDGGNVVRL
jgi:UDP-N-acetyl-D-glucosamine dehydrogenase